MVFDIKDAPPATGDINENGPGGKYGYRIGHSDGTYTIPDRVLNSVEDRKVRVITIGAGVSGILMVRLEMSKTQTTLYRSLCCTTGPSYTERLYECGARCLREERRY